MQLSNNLKYYVLFALLYLLTGCHRDKISLNNSKGSTFLPGAVYFPFLLSEKTTIVNREQTNEKEGTYLKVIAVLNDSTFKINLPANCVVNNINKAGWMIGWPGGKSFYDAGNENLREINFIDADDGIVQTGPLLRGTGIPVINSRIVFWNKYPGGFKNIGTGCLIDTRQWPSFAGSSVEFGAIIYDSLYSRWIMYLQEVDTNKVQIYAATSTNLLNWLPYNAGKPVFTAADFNNTQWAVSTTQTPRLYSAINENGRWYFFLSGYNAENKRCIGVVKAKNPLQGPFDIEEKAMVVPGENYDVNGCFYPKICRAGNKFLMFYDGVDANGTEHTCMASSTNLSQWVKSGNNPVINTHYGWRSGAYTSEPNYARCHGDSIWLMVGGYKKYNAEFSLQDSMMGLWPGDKNLFNNNMAENGRYVSGNVMDAHLGVYLSVDGGKTFAPHGNNPIWINNYSDTLQNDHLGGDFFYTTHAGKEFIIYQAKSEQQQRYNILIKQR